MKIMIKRVWKMTARGATVAVQMSDLDVGFWWYLIRGQIWGLGCDYGYRRVGI